MPHAGAISGMGLDRTHGVAARGRGGEGGARPAMFLTQLSMGRGGGRGGAGGGAGGARKGGSKRQQQQDPGILSLPEGWEKEVMIFHVIASGCIHIKIRWDLGTIRCVIASG